MDVPEKLYVPVFQFFMNEDLGYAYGTTGRAYRTYEEARRFLLDGGWKASRLDDEEEELFWRGDWEVAKIEEVVIDG